VIEHLAKLASLELDPKEREALEKDLQKIIAYVDELQAIDVEGVPPTTSMGGPSAMRADDPEPSLTIGEGFTVPVVIE
jgi:aspartyl-tRNA(Asn)/glutamyl-tRNA(Gln) amidotransferase subunit C